MRPIRRGQVPIKVPFAVRTNNQVMGDWIGEVREAIRNLSMRLPQAAAPLQMGGSGSSGYQSTILPTKFINTGTSESPEWKVEFTSAMLFEHSMNDAGFGHQIKIADGVLTDTPKKRLSIEEGEKDVWLKFKIQPNCEVEFDSPELVIGEPPEESPFHPNRPKVLSTTPGEGGAPPTYEIGSGGVTGNHRQKIGTITLEEGKRPVWKSVSPHAVVWIGQTEWEDSVPGEGQSIYHKYEEGLDRLKTLKNAEAGVEEGEEGVLNDEAEPFSEHVVFARICQKASDPQIHVKSEGENAARKIIIEGNNVNFSISGKVKELTVNDGLVVAASEDTDTIEGWWGVIRHEFHDIGDTSNDFVLQMTYENGLLKLVEHAVSSGTLDEVPGDEETPGAVTVRIENDDT